MKCLKWALNLKIKFKEKAILFCKIQMPFLQKKEERRKKGICWPLNTMYNFNKSQTMKAINS